MVEDIKNLLLDGELRKQMGENSRRYAEQNHDIKEVVKKHIEIFSELVKKE